MARLEELELLYLHGKNLSLLKDLKNLTSLSLYDESIDDVRSLADFSNLKNLSLNQGKVIDISPLAKLGKLESLSLCSLPVEDLAPLATLTGLRHLYLWEIHLKDFQQIASIKSLQEFECNSRGARGSFALESAREFGNIIYPQRANRRSFSARESSSPRYNRFAVHSAQRSYPSGQLKGLKSANFFGSTISDAQVEQLVQALPRCKISR